MMRYIKRFNEEVSYTYGNDINFLKGLEDDIEGIFVQVLDDGWVLDYQLTDYAGNIGWIKLRKESGGESKTIEELLPYLHHFYDYIKTMNIIHKINGGDYKVVTNNYKDCRILIYGLETRSVINMVAKFGNKYEVVSIGNLFNGLKQK
jgi:hypothetical protein